MSLQNYLQFYIISQRDAIHPNQRNARFDFPRFIHRAPVNSDQFKTASSWFSVRTTFASNSCCDISQAAQDIFDAALLQSNPEIACAAHEEKAISRSV